MYCVEARKRIVGIFTKIDWSTIRKGDLIRIYEMGCHIPRYGNSEFIALSDSYMKDGYWQFDVEYNRSVSQKSEYDHRLGGQHQQNRKHHQRRKDALK